MCKIYSTCKQHYNSHKERKLLETLVTEVVQPLLALVMVLTTQNCKLKLFACLHTGNEFKNFIT